MAKLKLRGKDLIKMGFPQGKVIGLAINKMLEHYRRKNKHWVLSELREVLNDPTAFVDDPIMGTIAAELIEPHKTEKRVLNAERVPHEVFGDAVIEDGAKHQLYTALKLPVAVQGALMPDAHHGYGLPIGGVLATENAVIPYGVGVDIGCRMCLSVYDLNANLLDRDKLKFTDMLGKHTRFGGKEVFDSPGKSAVLEHDAFKEIKVVRDLHHKAWRQLGTSGGGNHFVEFGIVEITDTDNEFDLKPGEYIGVLTHSGSRGLGANIARHYTRLAKKLCPLPKEASHLAWLTLDSHEGIEYWIAMNLAGDYASACHHDIHRRLGKALGERPVAVVENHHNFAWKESLPDGREVVVHRKGATPASEGELGIIPGSMASHGFIVRGKGNAAALNSASHGAGRKMSRTKAKSSLTNHHVSRYLKDKGIVLIGGGLDEAPMAYKDIYEVMEFQNDLVDVVGTFMPRIVRMDG